MIDISSVIRIFKTGTYTIRRSPTGSYVDGIYQKGGYPKDGAEVAMGMGRTIDLAPDSYWRFNQGAPDKPTIVHDLSGNIHLSPRTTVPPSPIQGVLVPSLKSKTVQFDEAGDGYLFVDEPSLDVGAESLSILWVGIINEILVGNRGLFGKRTVSAGYYVRVAESGTLDWNCESPTGVASEHIDYEDTLGKPTAFLFRHDLAADITTCYRWSEGVLLEGGETPASIVGSMSNDTFFRLGNFIFAAASANVSALAFFKGVKGEGVGGTQLSNLMSTIFNGASLTFPQDLSIQPVTGRDLKYLPEGQHANETRVVFSEVELKTRTPQYDPDIIEIDGEDWEVFNVEKWSHHYKAMAGRKAVP